MTTRTTLTLVLVLTVTALMAAGCGRKNLPVAPPDTTHPKFYPAAYGEEAQKAKPGPDEEDKKKQDEKQDEKQDGADGEKPSAPNTPKAP